MQMEKDRILSRTHIVKAMVEVKFPLEKYTGWDSVASSAVNKVMHTITSGVEDRDEDTELLVKSIEIERVES